MPPCPTVADHDSRLLSAEQARDASPCAVAWRRTETMSEQVELGLAATPFEDVILHWQAEDAGAVEDGMSMELGYRPVATRAERFIQQWGAWAAPRLPSVDHANMRRWAGGTDVDSARLAATGAPPCAGRRATNRHQRPPSTARLRDRIRPRARAPLRSAGHAEADRTEPSDEDGQRYFRTPFEGKLDDGYKVLGHVEEAPLPMLDALELRHDPVSDQEVLVAGVDDPLYDTAIHLRTPRLRGELSDPASPPARTGRSTGALPRS